MTLGEKIKELRAKSNITQKDLADKLSVTAQAVSRWENNDVEPSIGTLKQMATIFNVSLDELLDQNTEPKVVEKIVEKEVVVEKEVEKPVVVEKPIVVEKPTVVEKQVVVEKVVIPKPVLGVCDDCKKAITDKNDYNKRHFGRGRSGHDEILCKSCKDKRIEREKARNLEVNNARFKWSFIGGGILATLIFAICGALAVYYNYPLLWAYGAVGALLGFTGLSCIILFNNPVIEIWTSIANWSIHLPGVIFTLDVDGILFLITVKILGAVLSFIFGILVIILATLIAGLCSVFVYPYAIIVNRKHKFEDQ